MLIYRAPLLDPRVCDVWEAVDLSARSPNQAGLLQLQRGLGGAHLQGSHGFRLLRSQGNGVLGFEESE